MEKLRRILLIMTISEVVYATQSEFGFVRLIDFLDFSMNFNPKNPVI